MDRQTACVFPEPLETPRLSLRALTADAMDAWILGDARTLGRAVGARFPGEPVGPPLDLDDLVHVRDRLIDEGPDGGWWVWMVVLRHTREPIGLVTLAGDSEPDGGMAFGFSVDPRQQGHEYAEEAIEGVLAWTLAQPGVRFVRAAIPVGNDASMRVAEHVGMRPAGTARDPDLGEIVVFERSARRYPVGPGRS
jgi:RimJ/RimL family protein N-acetyltransferase